jgi:hypothetical protein
MADTKYSMSEATLNGFGLPTFNVASEPFGLTGFTGAMAQLGVALNAASLNIRLLTAEQGQLGKVLESLTAALFAPRPQLKAFSQVPRAGGESPFRLSLEVGRRPSVESPRLPMAHQTDNQPCTCELKSPVAVPTEHKVVLPMAVPITDKSAGHAMQMAPAAIPEKHVQVPSTLERVVSTAPLAALAESPPPASANPMTASLERLHNVATPDFSAPLDKLSSFAEQTPYLGPGLAAIAAGLIAIGSEVIDEARANIAKAILKWGASRLPLGLGKLIDEESGSGSQDEKRRSPKSGKDISPNRNDTLEGNASNRKESHKTGKRTGFKKQVQHNIEVRRRNLVPATTQTQGLKTPGSPAQVTSLVGRAAKAGTLIGRAAPPLRVLSAGINAAQGIANGDPKAIVSSAGVLAGSYAGATAGAALGTLILPGVGTAIGGLMGGVAGSGIGSLLGEKLGGLIDRLGAPEQVSKDLVNAQAQSSPINFSPSIQVTCTTPDSTEQIRRVVEQQLQAQFHGEFVPLMSTNALATRRDAALTDGGM